MAFAQQVAAQAPSPAPVPGSVPASGSLSALLAQDARLALVAERLLVANAGLCARTMPVAGMVVQSRDQYGADAPAGLFADGPVAAALVLPGSAAERAGLRAGDALVAIGAQRVAELRADGAAPVRDAAFAALVAQWPGQGPLPLIVARDGTQRPVTLHPQAGCRALVEVRTREALSARSDGRVIQIDLGLVRAAADEELAVIVAHELGHVVLDHRRRLEAAGVAKGFFGQFGRDQQRNRQMEIEADRVSVHLLANAGYDPALAVRFWRGALARRAAGGLTLSTIHPSPGSRADLVEREIADYLRPPSGPSYPGHLVGRRDMEAN